jgi:hypothetical protein
MKPEFALTPIKMLKAISDFHNVQAQVGKEKETPGMSP